MVLVATISSARGLCREKECLGWHDGALLVCHSPIAHIPTQ